MWKELQKAPDYYIFVDKLKEYRILITDYVRIWDVFHSEEELHSHLKKNNFGLEMDKNELLDKGLQMLQNPIKLKSIKILVNKKTLSISMSMSFGFPLKLSLNLLEGSQELFFQKITQPALQTIQDLRISESELRKLLITKDDEIEEYKSFGGKIRYRLNRNKPGAKLNVTVTSIGSGTNLFLVDKTTVLERGLCPGILKISTAIPPYNDKAHMEKHCTYNAHFGDGEVPLNVLSKIVDVPQDTCFIKEKSIDNKTSVKREPESQTSASNIEYIHLSNNIKNEDIKCQPIRKRKLNL